MMSCIVPKIGDPLTPAAFRIVPLGSRRQTRLSSPYACNFGNAVKAKGEDRANRTRGVGGYLIWVVVWTGQMADRLDRTDS